jgi:hypothetical protein
VRCLPPGTIVVLYLQAPKQKLWGVLKGINEAGVVMRGLDLVIFDDWMRQAARDAETQIGMTTVFYPLVRVERMEVDETIGCVMSYADRFQEATGRSVSEFLRRRSQRS